MHLIRQITTRFFPPRLAQDYGTGCMGEAQERRLYHHPWALGPVLWLSSVNLEASSNAVSAIPLPQWYVFRHRGAKTVPALEAVNCMSMYADPRKSRATGVDFTTVEQPPLPLRRASPSLSELLLTS